MTKKHPAPPATFFSQMCVYERYGLRLNVLQLSEVLGWTPGSIRNAINEGTFPIPTYMDGKRRYADFRDVAAHLDAKREEARQAALLL